MRVFWVFKIGFFECLNYIWIFENYFIKKGDIWIFFKMKKVWEYFLDFGLSRIKI